MFLNLPEHEDDGRHQLRHAFYALNCSEEEKAAFDRRFKVRLVNGYGLSEAFTIAVLAPIYGDDGYPAVGRPAFGREIRIVGPDGHDVEPGGKGEIWISGVPGRTIMAGYLNDPEATRAALIDGAWLRTGDVGYFDGDGCLHFFDRGKDVIKRGGENVSTNEVERVLTSHPAVAEVTVFGVPDPICDQAVKAAVILAPGAQVSEGELKLFCGQRLAKFKVPSLFEFRTELPKTSIGKIRKAVLLEEHNREAKNESCGR
jgi:carnitine-CoA ligase